jgi:uncharacterized protein (TIGR03790 family)
MGRGVLLGVLLWLSAASMAAGQTGANVLVVANQNSPDSVRVGDAYAAARAVPQDQMLRIATDATADEIDRTAYDRDIQAPIADWLSRHSAQDRILYIVLTKGVPLRIKGTAGRDGTMSSVDSELTLLYRRIAGGNALVGGPIANPYYAADHPLETARRFSRADQDIYLVTRLDGFTVDDALALIGRASKATAVGKVVLDQKAGLSDTGGDQWLKAAADWMTAHGFGDRLVLESTTRSTSGEPEVIAYYSWGSNDPAITSRHLNLGFVPGAIAGQFVSTDARTFHEPRADWKLGTWADRASYYAGSPQSLVGDLIRDGVTGASAYVAEPYLDATVRPNLLFPAYLSGFNLAESFYLAMPSLSWQGVVLGDPLCAPFKRQALAEAAIDKGLDPATELPAYFSDRSAQAMLAAGSRPDAVKLMLRAQARSAKGDKPGAQKALEAATVADPRLNAAHALLATTYEEQQEYDKAIERYRLILANKPANAVALNNLAYALAVRKNLPAEAVTYAERAYAFSPSPLIGDTLAWIQHLLGRDAEAARLLADMVRQAPGRADIRLHAAVVYAAVGMVDAAARELAEALRLKPDLGSSAEAAALRAKLGK